MQEPTLSGFTEKLATIKVPVVGFIGFSDSIVLNEVITNYIFETSKKASYSYDSNYVDAEDAYKMRTNYTFNGTEQTIDTGKLSVMEINTEQFTEVEGIDIK